jgi:hypothetical protein
LEELAEEAGVDFDELKESLQANWAEAFKAKIEEAVKNGDLTDEHADWLTEGLEKGFLGKGAWFGGRGKMGHFEGPGGERTFGDRPHVEGKPERGDWKHLPHCDQ